jgi:hypothetical protein
MTATSARERAYLSNARALGRRWRDYVGLVCVLAIVVAALLVVPVMPMRQLFIGFAVGAIAMAVVFSAARFDDWQVRGYLAETLSLESLRKVPNWLIVDNLPFDGVDVDHVVVTPSGVLAVESKHHNAVSAATARRDLDDARRAARKIRLFLGPKGHAQVTITPVLMIWGPGKPALPQGVRLVDGVYLVDPDRPELWSYQFAAPLLAPAQRVQIHETLADYARLRVEYDARKTVRLRTRVWEEFKAGVNEEREAREVRRALVRSRRRRHGTRAADPA